MPYSYIPNDIPMQFTFMKSPAGNIIDVGYSHDTPINSYDIPIPICSMMLEYLPTFARTKSPTYVGL
jgi:hypothetical protein